MLDHVTFFFNGDDGVNIIMCSTSSRTQGSRLTLGFRYKGLVRSLKPTRHMTNTWLSPLEILVKIFSYLAPLHVASVRGACRQHWTYPHEVDAIVTPQVCGRLYSISKDREIWLCILARYDYPLPSINRSSIPTMKLDRFLLQADIMKNIWIGQRTGKPTSVHAITLSPLTRGGK